MKVSGAAVISKTLPGVQHFGLRRIRQRGEVGKTLQPPIEVGHDRADLRLLKHDLGHQDCVGITGSAPREIATMAGVPA